MEHTDQLNTMINIIEDSHEALQRKLDDINNVNNTKDVSISSSSFGQTISSSVKTASYSMPISKGQHIKESNSHKSLSIIHQNLSTDSNISVESSAPPSGATEIANFIGDDWLKDLSVDSSNPKENVSNIEKHVIESSDDIIENEQESRTQIANSSLKKNIDNTNETFSTEMIDSIDSGHKNTNSDYISKLQIFQTPYNATTLGTLFKKCARIQSAEYIKHEDLDGKKAVDDFMVLYDNDYPVTINKKVIEDCANRRRKKQVVLPSKSDIKKLYNYAQKLCEEAMEILQKKFDLKAWKQLTQGTLILVQMFNRRRAGEIERLPIENYQNQETIDNVLNADIFKNISEESQQQAKQFRIDENQVSDLANFMGHHEQIHKDVYRIPNGLIDMTEVSRLLQAAIDNKDNNNDSNEENSNNENSNNENSNNKNATEDTSSNDDDNYEDNNIKIINDKPQTSRKKRRIHTLNYNDSDDEILNNSTYCSRSVLQKPVKRIKWTEMEKEIVQKKFGDIYKLPKLPSLNECRILIGQNRCLRKRTPEQLKSWIDNQRKGNFRK
ncbi:PREDICTED: probable serine/threonine-protein kinase DDB_G0283337 [Trachymyrmex cornetzi]|uniref:probable serine/threonine-protein kinase DDB_G0283337 n=1 Tax=Trachymyrmex cornetzi TaxID=471704 RepID=UPI00084F3283|nr:PREDICTED: probable serine/threonine-protein kinase DDB_G0283337 [Trachymyrmex cornetzi]